MSIFSICRFLSCVADYIKSVAQQHVRRFLRHEIRLCMRHDIQNYMWHNIRHYLQHYIRHTIYSIICGTPSIALYTAHYLQHYIQHTIYSIIYSTPSTALYTTHYIQHYHWYNIHYAFLYCSMPHKTMDRHSIPNFLIYLQIVLLCIPRIRTASVLLPPACSIAWAKHASVISLLIFS